MNLTDVMYGMRDMAGDAADKLRVEIGNAQKILDELDRFANDAEDGAQLLAASDMYPTAIANIPDRANMHHGRPGLGWQVGDTAHYCGTVDGKPVYTNEAAHQAEKNRETPSPAGPRTVVVVHAHPKIESTSRDYILYGQAITGWPILKATITEAPLNDAEREWLDNYLPAYLTPYGEIIHDYEVGQSRE